MKKNFPALLAACLLVSMQALAESPRIEDVAFESHGVQLAGSIAFPVGRPVLAGVVFIHGSGPQARNLDLAKRLAAEGIAALVYDKRGAGKSGGPPTATWPPRPPTPKRSPTARNPTSGLTSSAATRTRARTWAS